jgi:hypothetical protein
LHVDRSDVRNLRRRNAVRSPGARRPLEQCQSDLDREAGEGDVAAAPELYGAVRISVNDAVADEDVAPAATPATARAVAPMLHAPRTLRKSTKPRNAW